MTTVVAAIDNSAAARPVLATALAVAGLLGAEPDAVHVRENGDRTARLAATAAGITLRTLEGPQVETLIREGEEDNVSAVVAGARGTPSGRRPAGHVALSLIQALQKPVALVPPQTKAPPRLARFLIPLDGTGQTANALRPTIELAHDSSIDVTVLHVLAATSLPAFSDQPQHEVEAWTHEFLARYARARKQLDSRCASAKPTSSCSRSPSNNKLT
jgi:nucleotide-binding universal stress UspA family protein